MIRRRRRAREIAFSFDSFLDVVANVVGIIIRLILVAWVGARSYSSLQLLQLPAAPVIEANAESAESEAPLQPEVSEQRRELAEVQKQLLEKLRELQHTQEEQTQVRHELETLALRGQGLEHEKDALNRARAEKGQTTQAAALSLAEVHQRCQRLLEEIRAVEKLPSAKGVLRYRTPVSKPLHTEELLFECRNGRVTFIDLAPMLAEVRQGVREKEEALRTQWQVSDVAGPVGAFQLRYTIERERGALDAVAGGAGPDVNARSFRYGLTEWQIEPVAAVRGEKLDAALAPGSQFRQVVDRLDPQFTAVTFCVYPDSFEMFRRLRDYLYDKNLVVAGRPLPEDVPIAASSRHGSVSRGQ
jgi:hypothetical protein